MRTLVLVRPKVVLGLNNFDIAWITNVTTFMRSHVEVSKDLGLLLSGVFEIHEQKYPAKKRRSLESCKLSSGRPRM